MERTSYDTVILSDLHLGSETSRADEALATLQALSFRRLILLGDIFCDLNFRRLKKKHWKFLSYIRKLSNPRRNIEVVWVEGNHDYGLSELMSHLVGVPVYQEYVWESGGQRCIAIHGHQFDEFVVKDRLCLCSFLGYVYLLLQKLDTRNNHIARALDKLGTRWMRMTPKVAEGALAYARSRGATRVFCGHTHDATMMERDGILYFNTGAWTHESPTYVTLTGSEICIHGYSERIDHRDSSQERGEAAATPAGVAGPAGLPVDGDYEPAYC